MSGWQPGQYDPRQQRRAGAPAVPPGFQQQEDPWQASQQSEAWSGQPRWTPAQPQYQPRPEPRYQAPVQQPQPYGRVRKMALTAAESFWYVLMCIGFGVGYFAKIPAKKALQDFGMAQMTTAEQFWYVLMCLAFGGGYWAKIPVKKALSEMHAQPGYREPSPLTATKQRENHLVTVLLAAVILAGGLSFAWWNHERLSRRPEAAALAAAVPSVPAAEQRAIASMAGHCTQDPAQLAAMIGETRKLEVQAGITDETTVQLAQHLATVVAAYPKPVSCTDAFAAYVTLREGG